MGNPGLHAKTLSQKQKHALWTLFVSASKLWFCWNLHSDFCYIRRSVAQITECMYFIDLVIQKPPFLFDVVLGIKPRAFGTLGDHTPQASALLWQALGGFLFLSGVFPFSLPFSHFLSPQNSVSIYSELFSGIFSAFFLIVFLSS